MGRVGAHVMDTAACPADANPERSNMDAKIFPLLKHPKTPSLRLVVSERTLLIFSLTGSGANHEVITGVTQGKLAITAIAQ